MAGLWWVLEAGAYFNLWDSGVPEAVRPILLWLGLPLAIGVAIYTAYLFSQAEGRDLWQSSLLPIHLLFQAVMAGSGAMLVILLFLPDAPDELGNIAWTGFVIGVMLDLFVLLIGEFSIPHASEVAAQAAHEISHGHYKNFFWWGSVALGHVLPLILGVVVATVTDQAVLGAIAGISAVIGLYLYEYAFVMAPQEIPNS